MKAIGVISATALFLLLGVNAPADAQEPQQEKQDQKAQPPKHEQQAKPAKQERQAKPERQQQAKEQQDQQRQQREQQDKSAKQQQQQAKGQQDQQRQLRQQQERSAREQQHQANRPSPQEQHGQQRAAWQQDRAHSWQSEHRTWQQRGGYNGYRIPDDRFRGHFGRDHEFRIYSLPVMVVGGQRRFQYGGYWFGLVDPWPEYWSDNWYDDDDMYVDYYDNGYYMYNRRYPNDRIAISIYLN